MANPLEDYAIGARELKVSSRPPDRGVPAFPAKAMAPSFTRLP
jgi:hypothetical protein